MFSACKAANGNSCYFPFKYKGETHSKCSKADSHTPWCATDVDSHGDVIHGKWADCNPGCPGTSGGGVDTSGNVLFNKTENPFSHTLPDQATIP